MNLTKVQKYFIVELPVILVIGAVLIVCFVYLSNKEDKAHNKTIKEYEKKMDAQTIHEPSVIRH